MQRLATQQCVDASHGLPQVLTELLRRLACPSAACSSLHTSAAPHKQKAPYDPDNESASDAEEQLPSGSDAEVSSSGSDDEASTSSAAAAAAAAESSSSSSSSGKARHLGLDDPAFNFTLNYNLDFVTDPERWYAIGQTNAEEQRNRLELRKALAAHRLQLKDAAAAAGDRKQPGMAQQMHSRLADMQNYLSSRLR